MGHQAGLKTLRKCIEHCAQLGISSLTVFAFSSENWNRPASEVSRLMDLMMRALNKEAPELHDNNIRLRFIGDRSAFKPAIQEKMTEVEILTAGNRQMTINIAANYGGRWDITQAARHLAAKVSSGDVTADEIDEELISRHLTLAGFPDPDLFIRTGGEMRVSNFLLWQSAYTELYFTPVLWPDFGKKELNKAISVYCSRERRFGRTSEQVKGALHA